MLTSSTRKILDPEFVVPSAQAMETSAFWDRMLSMATDRSVKLGPATLEALEELLLVPPPRSAIAERDFWSVITHFMSRGFAPSDSQRTMCEPHILEMYAPLYGDPANIRRLLEDTQASGERSPLGLVTLDEVWNCIAAPCQTCDDSLLVRLSTDDDEVEIARAWRRLLIADQPNDLDAVSQHADQMFPRITFHPDAWKHLNDLDGDYAENVSLLIHHLGVLNDAVVDVWSGQSETVAREAALGALGVEASPESPKTRRDKKKIKRRDFAFGDQILRCEWHTKLRPNANRIHFAVKGGVVYVGTIVHHLPV